MADRLKSKEDLMLESMFRSEPVRDDGFSVNVISGVRRRLWVRRFSIPIALIIGMAIGAKPLAQLAMTIPKLLAIVPESLKVSDNVSNLSFLQISNLPASSTVVLGAMLLATVLLAGKLLED